MDSANQGKNDKKKPFRLTKELIRLALSDGWTQQEIAEKCRTQQSIVSAWKKGSKLGTEQQLLPLLNIYGHKLRRNTFKMYWNVDSDTEEKIFYRVEGKIIFSQAFCDARRSSGKILKKIPIYKLVVHHQGKDQFLPILQNRIKFIHTNEELENSVQDVVWASIILDKMNSKELIEFADLYAKEQLINYPSDANALPFLIRQALMNYGFCVDEVVTYPAVW